MTFFHWIRKTKPEVYKQHVFGDVNWVDRVESFKRENKHVGEYLDYCKTKLNQMEFKNH